MTENSFLPPLPPSYPEEVRDRVWSVLAEEGFEPAAIEHSLAALEKTDGDVKRPTAWCRKVAGAFAAGERRDMAVCDDPDCNGGYRYEEPDNLANERVIRCPNCYRGAA